MGFGAARRRGAPGSSSVSSRLEVRDDTVAGRKSSLFRLGFISSARLKEGGKTDFDRERERRGRLGCSWADWAGSAARREREYWAEIGPMT